MMIIPAYASCQSIHECRYANLESTGSPTIVAPDEIMHMEKNVQTNILIYGTLADGTKKSAVTIVITAPDKSQQTHTVMSGNESVFSVWHPVIGSRDTEGRHTVSAAYSITVDLGYDSTGHKKYDTAKYNIGSTVFYTKLAGLERGDATVTINPVEIDGCSKTGKQACYDRPKVSIDAGQTVEWYNDSDQIHNIHSIALGYGREEQKPIDDKLQKTVNFFETNILKSGHSRIIKFAEPGTVLYSCLYHPWMEGTIRISSSGVAVPESADSILDFAEEEIKKPVKIILDLAKYRHTNAGEIISAEFAHPGKTTTRESLSISVYDPDGNRIDGQKSKIESDGTGRFGVITQPTWKSGKYEIVIRTENAEGRTPFMISEHKSIKCRGINIQNITDHGHEAGCFADHIAEIIDGDTLRIGQKRVTTSIAIPVNATAESVSQICPVGSVAVVDRDTTLGLDSRISSDALTRQYYSVVYCTGSGISLNQQLIQSGLSRPDSVGCLTSEFADMVDGCEIDLAKAADDDVQEKADDDAVKETVENDCPIALAVYGTSLAHQVQVLREYRADMIGSGWSPFFDTVHAAYYVAAPHIADMERASPLFKNMVLASLIVPVNMAVLIGEVL